MMTFRKIMRKVPDGSARHLLRSFNLKFGSERRSSSVKELAEKLGFAVELVKLPVGMAGRLVQDTFSENGYCIEVNVRDSVKRRRFTVLHEMAHYFLHTVKNEPLAPEKLRDRGDHFYSAKEQQEEREADEFAAALLFDDGVLTAAYSLFGGDIEKLSNQFGVSTHVVKIGIHQFVPISERKSRGQKQ